MMPDEITHTKSSSLDAALELLEMGFSIIPVARASKKSLIPWQEFQKRHADPDEVEGWFEQWPDANIAIVCGDISGVVFVDQDAPEGGEWIKKNLPFTPVKSKTCKGWHHAYRHPGHGILVQNQVGVVPGVDIRGDGGYVVAPPSVHESGHIYQWEIADGFDFDLEHCPIFTLGAKPKPGVKHDGNLAMLDFSACKPAPVVRNVPEGQRNHELARVVGKWIAEGQDDEMVRLAARGWNSELTRPLPPDEVAHTVGSIWATHLKNHPEEASIKTSGIEVMDQQDVAAESMTLHIPDHILNPGGLISLGIKALNQPGLPKIPQYSLPVVLTTVAHAVSGKLVFKNTWPNLYNVKVGGTSTGKTTSDRVLRSAIMATGATGFYGVTDFSSGPALMRSMVEQNIAFVVIDEATGLFRRYAKTDPVTEGKREALLEIFSKSGDAIKKAYSDSKNTIEISKPCLSLTGNVTPAVFDVIKPEDFETGLMQRFDFWCYDGPIPYRDGIAGKANQLAEQFAAGIVAIMKAEVGEGNLQGFIGSPHNLEATPEAEKLLEQYSIQIVDEGNTASSRGETGIISRKFDLACKYAIIHAASTREPSRLTDPIDAENVRYGIAVAEMLCGWKIDILSDKVTSGDFHRDCEIFKNAIRAVMRTNQRPTFKTMANRRRELKNWQQKYAEQIISILSKRSEIVVDESKRPTAYYLAKNTDTK